MVGLRVQPYGPVGSIIAQGDRFRKVHKDIFRSPAARIFSELFAFGSFIACLIVGARVHFIAPFAFGFYVRFNTNLSPIATPFF